MTPDQIPTEITKLTYRRIQAIGNAGIPVLSQNQTAEFLSHYWPDIEAHIRNQIANDIEQDRTATPWHFGSFATTNIGVDAWIDSRDADKAMRIVLQGPIPQGERL